MPCLKNISIKLIFKIMANGDAEAFVFDSEDTEKNSKIKKVKKLHQGEFGSLDDLKDLSHISRVLIPCDMWREGRCSCKHFMKKYLCKHLLAVAFIRKLLEPRIEAKRVFLGQKTKRVHPKRQDMPC